MKGKVTVIRWSDKKTIHQDHETKVGYDQVRDILGGPIETVPHFDEYKGERCVAFCHEEGKLEGRPLNMRATALWWVQLTDRWASNELRPDYLVGEVVIVQGDDEFMADWLS